MMCVILVFSVVQERRMRYCDFCSSLSLQECLDNIFHALGDY